MRLPRPPISLIHAVAKLYRLAVSKEYAKFRNPTRPDDDFKARQKQEIDRYRAAIEIVQRLREAGVNCELFNDLQNGH
jgi:hypothetical protein